MDKKLPDGWEWKKLGDVIELKYGKGLKEDHRNPSGSVPVYGSNGVVGYHTQPLINGPGIIVGRKGSIGEVHLSSGPFWPIDTTYYIERPNGIEISYLFHMLKTLRLGSLDKSTAIPGLNRNDVYSIIVPMPPLDIQHKIVAILDKAEETKRLRAQANELTQRLLLGVFLEMFGDPVQNPKRWDVRLLGELASEIVDCPHSTPEYVDDKGQYACIRTTELKAGYIDWCEMKYVDELQYSERTKRLAPSEGDIVYGREGTFGIAIRVPEKARMCLGQRVMLFRPDPKLCTSEFLWALLNSPGIYRQALSKTSGSTVGHVNVKDIVRFAGFCPPMHLQEKFSLLVKKVESLRDGQSLSHAQINNLLNAIQAKAFTGELVS